MSAPPRWTVTQVNICWSCWKLPCIMQARQKGCCWPPNMLVVDEVWSLDVQIREWALRNRALHWIGGMEYKYHMNSVGLTAVFHWAKQNTIGKLQNRRTCSYFLTHERKPALPSHICFFDLSPCSLLLAVDGWFGKCIAGPLHWKRAPWWNKPLYKTLIWRYSGNYFINPYYALVTAFWGGAQNLH